MNLETDDLFDQLQKHLRKNIQNLCQNHEQDILGVQSVCDDKVPLFKLICYKCEGSDTQSQNFTSYPTGLVQVLKNQFERLKSCSLEEQQNEEEKILVDLISKLTAFEQQVEFIKEALQKIEREISDKKKNLIQMFEIKKDKNEIYKNFEMKIKFLNTSENQKQLQQSLFDLAKYKGDINEFVFTGIQYEMYQTAQIESNNLVKREYALDKVQHYIEEFYQTETSINSSEFSPEIQNNLEDLFSNSHSQYESASDEPENVDRKVENFEDNQLDLYVPIRAQSQREQQLQSQSQPPDMYVQQKQNSLPIEQKSNKKYVLEIRNLHGDTTLKDVQNYFSKCGVKNINIKKSSKGKCMGFGVLELSSLEGKNLALTFNGSSIHGQQIKVGEIKPDFKKLFKEINIDNI